jgi:hypothetical protein
MHRTVFLFDFIDETKLKYLCFSARLLSYYKKVTVYTKDNTDTLFHKYADTEQL